MTRIPLKEAAQGRWKAILPAVGLPLAITNGKHQACPLCGGTDRFRFDDKDGRGTWICGQCGAGDGIELVKRFCRVEFKEAARLIEGQIGSASYELPPPPESEDARRGRMRELWNGSLQITCRDPAGMWLTGRTGVRCYPSALRYHGRVPSVVEDGKRSFHPAMLAKVTDAEGQPVNIHRTYLTIEGTKAALDKPRAVMAGGLPEGCSVRLSPPAGLMGIAEGIETAIAASMLHEVPCWSALNAVMLSKWHPPAEARHIMIFADNDANYMGQHAAYQLANRLVIKHRLTVEVHVPRVIGTDWNDVLRERGLAQVAA